MKILILIFLSSHLQAADIVVIGEKLEQDPFDFAGSLTRYTQEELAETGAQNIRDISEMIPNFQIVGSSSSRYITPYIRGIGNQDLNVPDDVSVTFYLDEVPLPRYAFENELIQLEKIEVLKGPQGTLFGRNTQAGAVLLTTQQPKKQNENSITLGAGNLGQQKFLARSNYVLSHENHLYGSSAIKLSQRDGWIPDQVLNKDLGERRDQAFHQSIMYNPHEKRRWTLKVGGQREDGSDPFFIARETENYPVTAQNISPDYRRDLLTSSVKVEERINQTEVTFISAFNYYDFDTTYDEADGFIARDALTARVGPMMAEQLINDPNSLYRSVQEYERQFFNELRFKTKFNSHFTLTSGLNHTLTNYRLMFFVDTFTQSGPTEINQDVQLLSRSLSAFSQGDLKLTEKLTLSLGLRANHDRKEYKSDHNSTMPALNNYQQNTADTFSEITGKAAALYHWSSHHVSHMSFSRGYQPGGYPSFQFNNYSGLAADQPPFQKSTSWAYEVGHKAQALNRKLHYSANLFFNDVKNQQVRVQDPMTALSFYENIDVRAFGAELQTSYLFDGPWMIGANAGYTNSRFTETVVSAQGPLLTENDRLANIPYWNGDAFIQYTQYSDLLSGLFSARLAHSYVGARLGENMNVTELPSFSLWNLRIALERKSFDFSLNVRNLFNKQYESQAFLFESLNTTVSSPGLPRLVHADLTYHF